MFDVFAKLLSSITSFLLPLFASYKALKTSDPAQLTPWLMYWVVLSCVLLVESWTDWILRWIPFYSYIRLGFLLYLILPQTQGARVIYQTHLHPYLEQNESHIDDLITTAHERLRSAGLSYLKTAIDYFKTHILGLPASEASPAPAAAAATPPPTGPGSYTASLLARFSVPSARWAGAGAAATGTDLYSLLSSAVTSAVSGAPGAVPQDAARQPLVPRDLAAADRASFIAAQRARLSAVLSALDTEARSLEREDTLRRPSASGGNGNSNSSSSNGNRTPGDEVPERPPSGLSSWSGLSKSRSEVDFEKIDAESGGEEDEAVRRRNVAGAGSWMPFGWRGGGGAPADEVGESSGVEKG